MLETNSEGEDLKTENSTTTEEMVVEEEAVAEEMPAAAALEQPSSDEIEIKEETLVLENTETENPETENPEIENPETENTTNNDNAAPENNHNNDVSTLNPLNEPDNAVEAETKGGKHRRYWTPKEEEKFYKIWGRDNWRLTKHGKNTIFFAKWSDEMRDSFNIDVKPEEVQCKVNQTRAKFRQVKKLLETDKNYVKWKKYDIVERILKNQYRSKDDEPVPLEALENNRDVSPTELMNSQTQPSSPNSMSNMSTIPEHGINLSQSISADHQLTDEINMSNASLSDQNLSSNFYSNNSQSGANFSTELFGSDHLEIKQEIEGDLKREGFISEFMGNDVGSTDGLDQQSQLHQQLTQPLPQQKVPPSANNLEQTTPNPNSLLINNRLIQNHSIVATSNADGIININNHVNNNNNAMQPPKTMIITPSPRKRNRTPSVSQVAPISAETLEGLYLEEVRKRNVILVEQGEINRKRMRLDERKVKLMEEFFPKFMNLQQEILQKLDSVTNSTPEAINIKIED